MWFGNCAPLVFNITFTSTALSQVTLVVTMSHIDSGAFRSQGYGNSSTASCPCSCTVNNVAFWGRMLNVNMYTNFEYGQCLVMLRVGASALPIIAAACFVF